MKQTHQTKQASFRFRLNFKQQFFIFFLCSSVLPLLMFSILFLEKTRHILTVQSSELLRTGLLLSEELAGDELDKLALKVDTLPLTFLDNVLLRSRKEADATLVKRELQALLPDKRHDVIVLFDPAGHVVADTLPDTALRSVCLNAVAAGFQSASKPYLRPGRGLLEADGCLPGGPTILLGNLSSIVLPRSFGHPSGFFFLGRDIRSLTRHPGLSRLPSEISFRILRRAGNDRQVQDGHQSQETLTTLAATASAPVSLVPPLHRLRRNADTPFLFWEQNQTAQYRSLAGSIRDRRGILRGYVIASLPRHYWAELINEDTAYLIVNLLAAVLLVSLLGRRFNRAFVMPMQSLSAATHAIAEGNLDIRLEAQSDDPEIQRTLRDFNRMIAHLQEKEDLRQNFIATLTHDLRTPLIAQKRTLEFFRTYVAEQLDAQGVCLLAGLNVSNDNLLEMVNYILESFDYESGRISLHLSTIPFRELVDDCFRTLRPMAEERRIHLENQAPDTLTIQADSGQIKRVLLNLLGNAIQNITPDDQVFVKARIITESQTQSRLLWSEIIVSDTGPGLDDTLLPHVFDRYPTVVGRRQKIGSGLGLFICRMIVELHGGTISVSSAPKQGTHFRIVLPAAPSNRASFEDV